MRSIRDGDKAKLEFALHLQRTLPINEQVRVTIRILVEVLASMDELCVETPYSAPRVAEVQQ